MDPLIIAGFIVAVIAIVWFYSSVSTVAQTVTGGVAPVKSMSATTPLPSAGTLATIVTVTPAISQLTKKIAILKDVSHQSDQNPAKFADVGEVHAYHDNKLLTAGDFLDATIIHYDSPPMSKLTLTLKAEIQLTKIDILNRQDCCREQLNGTILILYAENGAEIFRKTLSGARQILLKSAMA